MEASAMSHESETVSHSVSDLLTNLKLGDPHAAERLWNRYIGKLLAVAKSKLGPGTQRHSDPEDVAYVAFWQMCRRAREDGFSKLDDRNDLWQVLLLLTERRARDAGRRTAARLRHEVGESNAGGSGQEGQRAFDCLPDESEVRPEDTVEVAELYERLHQELPEAELRKIVELRLAGFSHREIADAMEISLRSVERKVAIIKTRWASAGGL
jgi:RNA polymerase sigma factor (sigma-70 family)